MHVCSCTQLILKVARSLIVRKKFKHEIGNSLLQEILFEPITDGGCMLPEYLVVFILLVNLSQLCFVGSIIH